MAWPHDTLFVVYCAGLTATAPTERRSKLAASSAVR